MSLRMRTILQNVFWLSIFVSAISVLGACSHTVESRFYTLEKPLTRTESAKLVSSANNQKKLVFDLASVNLPAQVKGTRIVTSDANGQLTIHEFDRWSQPLNEEIRQTLSNLLAFKLNAIDLYNLPKPDSNVIQIDVNVQQFKNVLGQYASIKAAWTIKQRTNRLVMTCETEERQTIESGVANAVRGQQHILDNLSNKIAKSAVMAVENWKSEKASSDKSGEPLLDKENFNLNFDSNKQMHIKCVPL